MKKAGIFIIAVVFAAALVGIYEFEKCWIEVDNKCEAVKSANITKMKNLSELMNKSDVIAEVTGTDKSKSIDYKGMKAIISEVKVNEVFKGSNDLKTLNIIQVENLDVPPQNGQRLLMFLRKDRENMADKPYAVVGAGQGIYILDVNENNQTILKSQAIKNDNIIKELSGSYDEIKRRLRI